MFQKSSFDSLRECDRTCEKFVKGVAALSVGSEASVSRLASPALLHCWCQRGCGDAAAADGALVRDVEEACAFSLGRACQVVGDSEHCDQDCAGARFDEGRDGDACGWRAAQGLDFKTR